MAGKKSNRASLRCSGDLTIRTVRATHEAFCAEFKARDEVILDITKESDIDLTFVQLIEAARLTAARQSKKLSLARPATGVLLDVLKRGGFVETATDAAFWLHSDGRH